MASDPQAVDLLTVPCKLRHSQPNKDLFLMGEVTFNVDAQKSWLRLPLVGYWTDGLAGCGELLATVVVPIEEQ